MRTAIRVMTAVVVLSVGSLLISPEPAQAAHWSVHYRAHWGPHYGRHVYRHHFPYRHHYSAYWAVPRPVYRVPVVVPAPAYRVYRAPVGPACPVAPYRIW